ncbi:hypothetical protein MAR_009595 [Mya arenaria]|uniref:Chitin-binding type-2 domain-containing protein n=1 Tax=Mya arenaria TaxID=6604 RepID=A0ABY7DZ70_MYAAR|nr:hypothetical protein MAR_009595 [Mya arenaria]
MSIAMQPNNCLIYPPSERVFGVQLHGAGRWGVRGGLPDGHQVRQSDCQPPNLHATQGHQLGYMAFALNVNTPCGTFRDCSIRDDGGFPDLETHCAWYFMCSYGIFYGHHKCAGGLVWNSVLQTCDFPGNTLPPCGTKP